MKYHIFDNPPVHDGPPAPGQTNAHRQDTNDDPMREIKFLLLVMS